jgi:hypothetical protein
MGGARNLILSLPVRHFVRHNGSALWSAGMRWTTRSQQNHGFGSTGDLAELPRLPHRLETNNRAHTGFADEYLRDRTRKALND